MQIEKIDTATWKKAILNIEQATFFHHPEWFQIWKTFEDRSYECLRFKDNKGNTTLVPLSKSKTKIRGKDYWVSAPQGTYGGLISSSEISQDRLVAVQKHISKIYPTCTLFSHPFITSSITSWISHETQMIDLSRSWEKIEGDMKKARIRSRIPKAQDSGLSLEKMKRKEIPAFYAIYQKLREQWDNPTNNYDIRLFEIMYGVEGIDFWGLYKEGKLIGGGPFVRHKTFHVSSWLPVCDRAYTGIHANLFMYYSVIKYYKENNFRYFDFNPSGGHEGVQAFKKKLGAKIYTYYEYEKLPLITQLSNKIRGKH